MFNVMAKKKPLEITFARKVELLLDQESALRLDGQSKIANKLQNLLTEKATDLRAAFAEAKQAGRDEVAADLGKVLYTQRGLRNLIPDLRADHPYLNSVHSSPLKNIGLKLARAIEAYQACRAGRRPGPAIEWPRFHAWKKGWTSLEYDEPKKGWKVVDGTKLQLSFGKDADGKRLGVTGVLKDPPPGLHDAKCVRITRDAGRYFAIFTMAKPRRKPRRPRAERVAYIDPNSKNFGVSVDVRGCATEIANLPGLVELDRTIDRLKRKRDRKVRRHELVEFQRQDGSVHRHWQPSAAWTRHDRALKRLEYKRRERIKQFLYSVAHALFDRYDAVGLGNWAPANGDSGLGRKANRTLRNRRHLGQFKHVLQWVALKRRKLAFVMDERGTTRTCSCCGHVVEGGIHPNIRSWVCPSCHAVHGRDENAAKNGLRRLVSHLKRLDMPCSGPAADVLSRCSWSFSFGRHEAVDHEIKGDARRGGRCDAALINSPPALVLPQ